MEERRIIAHLLRTQGHSVLIMEDIKDRMEEDLIDKFDRILRTKQITDIVVYWPANAKMQTTYDEFILPSDRANRQKLPNVWVVHHTDVAHISQDRFLVQERGGRSRYLEAVARLGVRPLEWKNQKELRHQIQLLAKVL